MCFVFVVFVAAAAVAYLRTHFSLSLSMFGSLYLKFTWSL